MLSIPQMGGVTSTFGAPVTARFVGLLLAFVKSEVTSIVPNHIDVPAIFDTVSACCCAGMESTVAMTIVNTHLEGTNLVIQYQ